MSIRVSEAIELVRNLCVDRVEGDRVPAFSDTEILRSINVTRSRFFGMRPEAFSVHSFAIAPPPDITVLSTLVFAADETCINVNVLPVTLGSPIKKVALNFKTGVAGTLLSLGEAGQDVFLLFVDEVGVRLSVTTTEGAPVVTDMLLPGAYLDNTLHSAEVSFLSGSLVLRADLNQLSRAVTVPFEVQSHMVIGGIFNGDPVPQFSGSIYDVVITGEDEAELLNFALAEGSGSEVMDTVSDTIGVVTGDAAFYQRIDDDADLGIIGWAVQQFCYGAAAFLLSQRSKDAFYRKAADQFEVLFKGG